MASLMSVCQISVLKTHKDFFDYLAGDQLPAIGARVWVPYGTQTRLGIVISHHPVTQDHIKLKSIQRIIDDAPLLSLPLLALCQWVSRYYQAPLSEVMALVLPKKYRLGLPRQLHMTRTYTPHDAGVIPPRARQQQRLFDYVAQHQEPVSEVALRDAGFQIALCKKLVALGALKTHESITPPAHHACPAQTPLELNDEQRHAVQAITAETHHYRCFLLYGVTGSGKTEVYLHLMAEQFSQGRQVLVLVPEIGLTPQLLERFRARFPMPMAVIHSHLNDTERQTAWQRASEQSILLVIGTRSAVFTPMPQLGLIIIDEEHDPSFKQMDGVRYSARDTALMRAHQSQIPIILGSATPSLEALHNALMNKFSLLRLTQKAQNNVPLHIQITDLRQQNVHEGFAASTLSLIKEHLARDHQVLVFINRRGFAPILLCHVCGWMADCHACDTHLTFHRTQNRLICHHCGASHARITRCQKCGGHELLPIGVGTQRVHDYLAQQCPHTNIVRIDRDEVLTKHGLEERLDQIHRGHAQLIIGTQMLAKGHHFPQLALVVILDADHGFYNQDFRSLERLGQLFTQVAGRAGRAHLQGHVILQTHLPHHPLLQILVQKGYDPFAHALLEQRAQAQLPPYHFMAVLRAQGKQQDKMLVFLNDIKNHANHTALKIAGPAPAPLSRKAHYFRMQLLFQAPSRAILHQALTAIRVFLSTYKHSGIHWSMDVDPQDLA